MTQGRIVTALGLAAILLATPTLADAQSRNRGGGATGRGGAPAGPPPRSSGATGRAVPRTGPPPRPGGPGYSRPYYGSNYYYPNYYYRPYYYYGPYSPGFSVGLSYGFGYSGFYGGFGYGYPYGYAPYGYGGYPYYGAYGYGYGPAYGGIRIDVPQRDAEVYADGYFAGTVDNYDGNLQQLNLEPGAHRIEVRLPGFESASFEVNVVPGRTITYRTALRPARP